MLNISEEDFKQQVEAVLVQIAEKDNNLQQLNSRFWNEIAEHKYLFDRQEKEIEVLKSLKKEEFIAHFERLFFSEHTKRFDLELNSEKHVEKQAEWKKNNNEKYY